MSAQTIPNLLGIYNLATRPRAFKLLSVGEYPPTERTPARKRGHTVDRQAGTPVPQCPSVGQYIDDIVAAQGATEVPECVPEVHPRQGERAC